MMQTDYIKLGAEVVTVCSLLHTFLPPWDFLQDFPKAIRYYKLFIYAIGYVALNGRSTVYQKTIAMPNQVPTPMVLEASPKTPVVVVDESGKEKKL